MSSPSSRFSTIRLENSTREVVLNQQQATQILSALVGQNIAQHSRIERALLGIQGVAEGHELDQSESASSNAQPVMQPANIGTIASDNEAEQPEISTLSTTGLPYDFRSAKDRRLAFKGKQCSLWCSCACHSRKKFRLPSPFGTLSGSFSGLPLLTRRCAERACQNSAGPSGSIVYRFPSWFWNRLMAITLSSIPICGPEINIRFPRVVITSKLYLFAMHGDISGVKNLFTQGAASPWDVNERGSSALYVSHTDFTLASFPVFR